MDEEVFSFQGFPVLRAGCLPKPNPLKSPKQQKGSRYCGLYSFLLYIDTVFHFGLLFLGSLEKLPTKTQKCKINLTYCLYFVTIICKSFI